MERRNIEMTSVGFVGTRGFSQQPCVGIETGAKQAGNRAFSGSPRTLIIQAMGTFAVVAGDATPTNLRLGPVLTPAQAVIRLRPGDVALGRLDISPSLAGIEPGLWALDTLERRGITVLNRSDTLVRTHDKLATAEALARAGVPHPPTVHVAPWLPVPAVESPLVLKPRFGSWGRDVTRCDSHEEFACALEAARGHRWYGATGAVAQRLVPPCGFDLRLVVAGGEVVGAVIRRAAPGEWRTNIALGGRRVPVTPPAEARALAVAAAEAVGGDLVGVDLLPLPGDAWIVLEVNGAVDFSAAYSFDEEVFSAAHAALLARIGLDADAHLVRGALGSGVRRGHGRVRRLRTAGPAARG
jgi:RimK family alpha-L-glutamate ligase